MDTCNTMAVYVYTALPAHFLACLNLDQTVPKWEIPLPFDVFVYLGPSTSLTKLFDIGNYRTTAGPDLAAQMRRLI